MDDHEIIDVHVHLFKNLAQERAGNPHPGRRDKDRWATPESAFPFMDRLGISKTVSLSVFPTREVQESSLKKMSPGLNERELAEAREKVRQEIPEKIRRHNEWACEIGRQSGGRLIPFIGIQPILGKQAMADEVAVRSRQGARGVKIHPGSHMFFPNSRELWPMYEKCQELGMAVLSDSGPYGGAPQEGEYGQPQNFAEVLEAFPRLTLILAHLGSAFWEERLELSRHFANVYFDTAQGFSSPDSPSVHQGRGLSVSDAVRIIHKIGVDRIMFGSDGPYMEVQPQLEQILALDLSDQEKRMILAENAKRIIKI